MSHIHDTTIQPKASHRYMDHTYNKMMIKILPGEFYVSAEDEYITTVLGSCISVCLYDPKNKIGGMNHFMLPKSTNGEWAGSSSATRYGNYAMEHLINALLKKGAIKHHMRAKIYGGASFQEDHNQDIGQNNIKFTEDYLKMEAIRVWEEDTGDWHSRRVTFHPQTGEVIIKKMDITNHTIINRDNIYEQSLEEKPLEGEITLF